ncbi:unnamed protein product [Ascophyllum nodosum]
MGPWAKRLRAGFDCYLQGDVLCALALYSEAAELGYDVAASNAAFILDRRKVRIAVDKQRREDMNIAEDRSESKVWTETMSIRFHSMAATEGHVPSFVAIGDAFFYGRSGLPRDPAIASWWYSRASASGLVRGSYNLGYMYEHGLGVRRDFALAWTYYERARKKALANDGLDQHLSGMPIEVLISLAKLRVMNVRRSYLRIRFNTSWTNHVRACGEV